MRRSLASLGMTKRETRDDKKEDRDDKKEDRDDKKEGS
jgi:hypothetical protein